MTSCRLVTAATGLACALVMASAFASDTGCSAQSGVGITPVVELYTSEGCSSCPPADRWASGLGQQPPGPGTPVLEAFHVAYWDNLGWVDRFANPAHTDRQRQIAQWNRQRGIYTPQVVLNGRDWPAWSSAGGTLPSASKPASVSIRMLQLPDGRIEAMVIARDKAAASWSAYWTVTEDGHASKVKAGENAGEYLKHDHVVRQYTPVGNYSNEPGVARTLVLRPIAQTPGHARHINLVIFDERTGEILQAVSGAC
ncbi:MAG: DUF1223 domain-containing protein [Burkholderiaceae bacterium]